MTQQFTAQYFQEFLNLTPGAPIVESQIREATLTDTDLVRDNSDAEIVVDTNAAGAGEIFDGFFFDEPNRFDPGGPLIITTFTGEISLTVTFSDGTSLDNVLALRDFEQLGFNQVTNRYLFDQEALASVGKTVADVVDVSTLVEVEHNLSWFRLGFFNDDPDTVIPVEEPIVEVANRIEGTAASGVLFGTDGADVIAGRGGSDILFGGAGADVFVFGAEIFDRSRDRDSIRDFDASEDTIVFAEDVVLRSAVERNGDVIIRFEGSRDTLVIENADISVLEAIQFTNEDFFA